jgi:proteasome assembly chaperone (PAC2) family protein
MVEELKLNQPWLVAVWPGMGNVALNAGVYLLAKLGMTGIAEFESGDLFDIEHVEVKNGLIQAPRRPRNRFFAWKAPQGGRDLVVFLGEAQPPLGKYPLCRQIARYARELGVERVFTFAAMATRMHPGQPSRVFAAATDAAGLEELKRLDLEVIEDGNIGGLNGVLLGVAAESGLRGACVLGEMPHIFSQLPFPKASLAILEVFSTLTGIELDFAELSEQAQTTEQQLGELLERVEQEFGQASLPEPGETSAGPEPALEEDAPDPAIRDRITALFERAKKDRTKAFELKRELDRLGLFKEYEDRFLDLFTTPE